MKPAFELLWSALNFERPQFCALLCMYSKKGAFKNYVEIKKVLSLSDAKLMLKFIYSEKDTKLCEIFTLLLFYAVPVKSEVEVLQFLWINWVNFIDNWIWCLISLINFTGKTNAELDRSRKLLKIGCVSDKGAKIF